MKIYKKIMIIFTLIIIIISIAYVIYAINDSNQGNDNKEKVLSEIKYLESKFVNILNTLNNIEYRNYKISTEKSNSNDKSENSNESSNSSSDNSESNKSSSGEKSSTNKEDTFNKYSLESQGILTNTANINWELIKNDLELIYTSIPVVTLDLYQMNLNKNDILNFNNELDSLTILVKNEDETAVLTQITKLYSYIPKFLESTNADEKDIIMAKTKLNIFEAYSVLELEKWDSMSNNISEAINTYNSVLVTPNFNNQKHYNINKCYIMLNELQNAINKKDKELFLIKYKNLLEEFNNI